MYVIELYLFCVALGEMVSPCPVCPRLAAPPSAPRCARPPRGAMVAGPAVASSLPLALADARRRWVTAYRRRCCLWESASSGQRAAHSAQHHRASRQHKGPAMWCQRPAKPLCRTRRHVACAPARGVSGHRRQGITDARRTCQVNRR